ncbi:cupin domain-containing protein [Colletotrichum graminicola]|uniref:CENP-C homolog n=1 Tax=Colletotrichum graminicola (strain M1.001 / M2 / FGSC 10212) TaxID=645133 RepID=E3QGI1_COLGM|nr:cupin domain-containing protein [Colletotrichum graminicola M1.001]EFQ29969.1 cupin domain-containing protein [Colletotrichum graminicola M1.001]WDK09879.1 cupin domain-containing protein [Colletotrichum graminicola]
MAPPRQSNVRRRETSTGDFHELGVKGRKTGIELPDTGVRDEHGMQPIDGLFSSPEKDNRSPGDDMTRGEQDMELESESGPGPASIMKNHPRLVPRGTSPRKTNLGSPAMRHPSFGPSSSPTRLSPNRGSPPRLPPNRGSSVSRRLDYGGPDKGARGPNGVNGRALSTEDEEDEDAVSQAQNGSPVENGDEESMQMVGMDGDDEPEPESVTGAPDAEEVDVEESVAEAPQPIKRRGRPRKAQSPVEEEAEEAPADSGHESEEQAPVKRRGRPAKGKGKAKADEPEEEPEAEASASRRRRSRNSNADEVEQEEAEGRSSKRQRTEPKKPTTGKRGRPKADPRKEEGGESKGAEADPKPKGKPGRKPKAALGDDSILGVVQKGPPMPKARGLVSQKRQQDPHAVTQTRSGRQSYRPLAFWKNEHVTYDEDEAFEDGKKGGRFLLPSVKEIIRVEEEEREARKSKKSKGRKAAVKGRRRHADSDNEEEPPEPWEQDPGSIEGEIVVWQPEHEFNPPAINDQVEVDEDRIAVAAGAIQTRDIRDATFRFAKTLSLPFFGSGVVDLPPGAEKRPKNSRKMQMVFFVFQGKVLVTVHETQFRIGAGGMWFVPRGNYYSIENDYETPARIFFAQGCEISNGLSQGAGGSQDTTIMG